MSRLVEEGWVAPDDPGPSRRWRLRVILLALPMLAWLGFVAMTSTQANHVTYVARVADDGYGRVAYLKSERTIRTRARTVGMETTVRTSRGTRFVVLQARVRAYERVTLTVDPPTGVDEELVSGRYVPPGRSGSKGTVIVTIPASSMPDVAATSSGPLRVVTARADARIAASQRDARLRDRLQDGWWWVAPLGLLASLAPLWLWRRARDRFFSMRVPGPGKKLDVAPPSSLDPVGAAVLLAGARPVDSAAAFAGHVLDLVERRQVRMRRRIDAETGHAGVQLGLAHAEEETPDDIAVVCLRDVALDDGVTVDVPDDPARVLRLSHAHRRAWIEHVAARVRFERAAVSYPAQRVAAAAAATAAFALAGLAGALLAPYTGGRLAGALVLAIAFPLSIVLGAWARDARRWRVVARERRHERAQWVGWRRLVGTTEGPALDPRNVPLVVATGSVAGLVRETAPPDAVGLDAVTGRTVESLHAMCAATALRAR